MLMEVAMRSSDGIPELSVAFKNHKTAPKSIDKTLSDAIHSFIQLPIIKLPRGKFEEKVFNVAVSR